MLHIIFYMVTNRAPFEIVMILKMKILKGLFLCLLCLGKYLNTLAVSFNFVLTPAAGCNLFFSSQWPSRCLSKVPQIHILFKMYAFKGDHPL